MPKKFFHLLALKSGVSIALAHVATKFFRSEVRLIEELFPRDWKAGSQYCSWFQEMVINRLIVLELKFFSDEAGFTLSGNVSSQSNKYLCYGNPQTVDQVSLHDLEVTVWYAVSARKIQQLRFFKKNSGHHIQLLLTPFLKELTEEEKVYSYLVQDNAMAYPANFLITVLQEVVDKLLIACQLWLPRSPDLNPCNFYLWVHKTDYM
jgi:hypothetical protein